MKIRRLAELAVRGRTVKRRMPEPFQEHSIIVSPDSQLKYLKPGIKWFDRMLIDVAVEYIVRGMIVWDIGANIGVFSVASAARGAAVVSFEADPWLVTVLERTKRLPENERLNIKVIAAAVSDSDGVGQFLIAGRGRASNALEVAGGHGQMGGVRERRLVPTLQVDTVRKYLPTPDLIKIDVEGAELLVLDGAKAALESRPILLIEVSERHNWQITTLLKSLGYKLFDAEASPAARQQLNVCSTNTLALPE